MSVPPGAPLDALLREALVPLGRALAAYVAGQSEATLIVHVEDSPPDPLPISYFFRESGAMGAVDRQALALARGRVLDVGACAGAHAVPLVRAGHEVTAIDLIPEAVEVLRARGVEDAREASVWSFDPGAAYDTILAMMNGTSLAGTAGGLEPLLLRLRELVAEGGQVLIDSTALGPDEAEDVGERDRGEAESVAVELHYQLEFAGERGPPFPQLFVDEVTLERAAVASGWRMEVVAREEPRYLARLTKTGSRDVQ